jgi:precorrin-3B C17-methyltransferase
MNDQRAVNGLLYVVGLGPGSAGLLTPDAVVAIDSSDTVVGYHGYLELIRDKIADKVIIGRDLGDEIDRAGVALDLAETGHTVALVSGGDAGIYGMGGVACELASARRSTARIVSVPGVTAASAAASLLGAPLAHDWASISLSDGLTPWTTIVGRVEHAARADLVLVFYNPASRRRKWQLSAIARVLLQFRPSSTPVGLVENAYRPSQRIEVIRLDGLEEQDVSMFTTVIVGSSRTFLDRGRMVTPRIYAAKVERSPAPAIDASRQAPGAEIMMESLAMIDRELGPLPAEPAERAVVLRMIHATADFDFAANIRIGPGALAAVLAAFKQGAHLLTDVQMLRSGIHRDLASAVGVHTVCAVDDCDTLNLAASEGITRSAAALRLMARRFTDAAVVAIGNAPTALNEAVRLIELEKWRPACVIGIPVGFIGVEDAKRRLMEQAAVPFITSVGRKGGTAATAAAVNALLELAR